MSKNYYPRFKSIIGVCIATLTLCLLMGSPTAIAQPTITSVSPGLGIGGTTSVTISGTNFSATAANDTVFFGATRATVSSASTTSLSVTVPVGAIYAPVSVLNSTTHLTGYQKQKFLPVYDTTCFTGMTGFINFKSNVDFGSTYPSKAGELFGIVGVNICDVDGDGKPDIVGVVSTDGLWDLDPGGPSTLNSKIAIFRNTSTTGTISATSFATPVLYTCVTGGINVKVTDMDGDGKPDILVCGPRAAGFDILRNLCTSGTISFAARKTYLSTPTPFGISVADFDADGKPDIAVVCGYDSLCIYRNQITAPGAFTNSSFSTRVDLPTGRLPRSLCTADMDGDGKPDIIITNSVDTTVSVYRNLITSSGAFTTSSFDTRVSYHTGTRPEEVVAGDLDGDGKPELVIADSVAGAVSVLYNNAASGTISSSSFGTNVDLSTTNTPLGVCLADVNGDGKLDIIASNAAGFVSIFRNKTTSTGSLATSSFDAHLDFSSSAFDIPIGIAAGDLDGDNRPDIVMGNFYANSMSIFRNYPLPFVDTIIGNTTVCASAVGTTYTDAATGGLWSITAYTGSSISATGVLTPGAAGGTDTIKYMIVCGGDTNMVTKEITITPSPVVGAISGPTSVCIGNSIALSDTTPSGSWTGGGSFASVSSAGVVSGTAAGSTTITYSKTTSCGTFSSYFPLTVNGTPGTITGPSSVCSGSTITLSASPTGGTWSVAPGSPATVGASTGVVSGVSGGTAIITYTNTSGCSATKSVTVNATGAPITGTTTFCVGTTSTLSDAVPGGFWYSLIPAVATVDSLTGVVSGIAGGTTIIYYGSGIGAPCSVHTTVNITPLGIPTVSISSSPSGTVCVGDTVTYTASVTNEGSSPNYQWKVNGVIVTSTTNTLTYVPENGDVINVKLFSSSSCVSIDTATANFFVTLISSIPVSVAITTATGNDTVCHGAAETFHATATNGGATPHFQWHVNGVLTSLSSSYSYVPANGDVVKAYLESSVGCPSSDTVIATIIMDVIPFATPTVAIFGDTIVCEGYPTELYANPTYAGPTPIYQWTVNGVNTSMANPLMYMPTTGDTIQLVLTSDYPCLAVSSAVSPKEVLTVVPVLLPSVDVLATNSIVLPGEVMSDHFTAVVTNGGSAPTYQWFIDDLPVPGATNPTFHTTALPHRDSVSCLVVNTDLCNGINVFDYVIVDTGHNVGVHDVNAANSSVTIVPNPNSGIFTVKGDLGMGGTEDVAIVLTNMMGQAVYTDVLTATQGTFDKQITLDGSLPAGMYLLSVHSEHMSRVIHFSLQR